MKTKRKVIFWVAMGLALLLATSAGAQASVDTSRGQQDLASILSALEEAADEASVAYAAGIQARMQWAEDNEGPQQAGGATIESAQALARTFFSTGAFDAETFMLYWNGELGRGDTTWTPVGTDIRCTCIYLAAVGTPGEDGYVAAHWEIPKDCACDADCVRCAGDPDGTPPIPTCDCVVAAEDK